MSRRRQGQHTQNKQQEKRPATPTFLLELPLIVDVGQAAHLEAARQLYNAILSLGQRRLRRMRADPIWHAARALPRSHKAERATAFSALRKAYGFTEAALHEAVKGLFTRSLSMHFPCALTRNEKVRTERTFRYKWDY